MVAASSKKQDKSKNIKKIVGFVILLVALLVAGVLVHLHVSSLNDEISKTATSVTGKVSVDEILAGPDQYIGAEVSLVGKIFNLNGLPGKYAMQVFTDIDNSSGAVTIYSTSTILLEEDDYVKVSGVVTQPFSGENAYGTTIENPAVVASSIEALPADEAVAPTLTTKTIGEQKVFGNLTVVLDKVEYAANETRLYFVFDNKGTEDYTFYSFNASLVQDRQKIEEVSDYDRGTYDYESTILAGVRQNVKLYYAKIDPELDATFKMEVTNTKTYQSTTLEYTLN